MRTNPRARPASTAVHLAAPLLAGAAQRVARPVAVATAAVTRPASRGTLVPIGGGYETPSLEGFGRVAAQGASGPTVDLVVVPRLRRRGGGPGREPRARRRSAPTRSTRRATPSSRAPYTGCTARLAVLLNREDAMDPANSAASKPRHRRHLHPRRRPGPRDEGARRSRRPRRR